MRNILTSVVFFVFISRNVLAVVAGMLLAYEYEVNNATIPFAITGEVDSGLPTVQPPPFSTTFDGSFYSFTGMVSKMGALVVFCPVIVVLEHMAVAKAFSKGKSLDATQEMLAVGLIHLFGSFVKAFPVAGTITRTAINSICGVKTTAGGIVTGIIVLMALGFLTSTFAYIPKATLAAVILVTCIDIINFNNFLLLWRLKRIDLIPFIATIVICLFWSLSYGILCGVAINLIFVMYSSARPKFKVLQDKLSSGREVYLLKPNCGLHFTSAEHLRGVILEQCTNTQMTVVLNGEFIGNLDITVAKTIVDLVEELKARGQQIILWNFKETLRDICVGLNYELRECFQKSDKIEHIIINNNMETILSVN